MKNKSSVIFFLLVFVTFYGKSFSQSVPIPKIETPNTASLGKYGDIPVSYFTGTPNISIPLYTITEGSIQIPISLSYHPGSVRPNEHPGWVGLGWNLHTYGKITRTPKLYVDEGNNASSSIKPYYPNPSYHGALHGATFVNTNNWDTHARIDEVFKYNQGAAAEFYDSNADEFSFSFGNYSGKFYYTANGWQVISDEPNLKVQETGFMDWRDISTHLINYVVPSGNGAPGDQSRMFRGFLITTPDGTKYTFGSLVTSGSDMKDGLEFAKEYGGPAGVMCNSWLLRKIEDKDGRHVTFEYQKRHAVCTLSFHSSQTSYSCYYDWYSSWGFQSGTVNTRQHAGYLLYPVYLSKILTSKQSVNFNISVATALRYTDEFLRFSVFDAPGNSSPQEFDIAALGNNVDNLKWYKLDEFVVQDLAPNPNQIKKVKFSYSTSNTQRLTLNSLSDQDKSSVPVKNYQFLYNDITGLPAYGGDQTDHWGYYNGTTLQGATYLNLINLRNTNPSLVVKGMLSSITYPTGGRTEFVWESNRAGNVVSINRQSIGAYTYGHVGGVRIKEIKNYSVSSAGTPLTTSYYYVKNYTNSANVSSLPSSGILNGLPQYYFDIPSRVASDGVSRVGRRLESVNSLVSYSYNGSSSHIGYSEVIEKLPDNSYNKYVYTNFNKYDEHDQDHYDKIPGVTGWIIGGTEDRYVTMSSLEIERGRLLIKESYSSANKLVKKDRNFYRNDVARFNDFIKLYDLRNSLACRSDAAVVLASAYKGFKYSYYIVKTEESIYDPNGTNPLVSTTMYEYNSSNQLSKTSVAQSDNSALIKKLKYPSDYSIVSAPNWQLAALQSMKSRNIISPVIEHQEIKEVGSVQKLVKGGLVLYKTFDGGLLLPQEELKLDLAIPSTNLNMSSISGTNQLTYHNDYKNILTVDQRDNKGNPLQIVGRTGIKKAFEWGYNSEYPIVEIVNAVNSLGSGYISQTETVTIDLPNQGTNRTANFTSYYSGQVMVQLTFTDHPPAPYHVLVGYTLSGPSTFTGTVCAAVPLSQCNPVGNTIFIDNVPAGTYTLSLVSNVNTTSSIGRIRYSYEGRTTNTTGVKNFFHTSFEETEGNSNDAKTGKRSKTGGYTKSLTNLTAGRYVLSYWQKSGSTWTYVENNNVQVTGTTYPLSIGNTIHLDEVRFYPYTAQMTTYTYEPLVGMTSQCDVNNRITYYEYDGFQRLVLIRDQDKNIIKKICYNYAGQPEDCVPNVSPNWQATGTTRCQPCAANTSYTNNIRERQERDNNTSSPTYNQLRWVSEGVNAACTITPGWTNTATAIRCKKNASNVNTGEQEQEQKDMNPCSPTYNQLRWVVTGTNTTACPLACNTSNCTGTNRKCVNGSCETAIRFNTNSYSSGSKYVCVYHYQWSDGSRTQDFTETNNMPCAF